MNETYTLKYSKGIVTRAVRSYFLRKLGPSYFIALVLLIGYFIYELKGGNLSWLVGLLGTVIGFGLLLPIVGIIGHSRVGLQKLAEMPDATATLTITDDGLVIRSAIGSSEITWKTITEVWQYTEYWVILSSGHFLMTIPQSELDYYGRNSIRAAFEKVNIKMA